LWKNRAELQQGDHSCLFTDFHDIDLSSHSVFLQSGAVVSSGLLLMAVLGLLPPTVLHYTHSEVHSGKSGLALSRFSSCIMLVAYACYIYFELSSSRRRGEFNEVSISDEVLLNLLFFQKKKSSFLIKYVHLNQVRVANLGDANNDENPEMSKWEAIAWLAILTVWISVLSDYLVDAIDVSCLFDLLDDYMHLVSVTYVACDNLTDTYMHMFSWKQIL
jgi:Ca2+/H+ antiporter